MTPEGLPDNPNDLLGLDSPVRVTLSEAVRQIATAAGFAAAEKVMSDHVRQCQPHVHNRLGALEDHVDDLRISRARLTGMIAAAGILSGLCGGGGVALAVKLLGG